MSPRTHRVLAHEVAALSARPAPAHVVAIDRDEADDGAVLIAACTVCGVIDIEALPATPETVAQLVADAEAHDPVANAAGGVS